MFSLHLAHLLASQGAFMLYVLSDFHGFQDLVRLPLVRLPDMGRAAAVLF